ncbi:MAG: hypothetical protein WCH11_02250 [Bdellovibrio sp.]
MSEILPTTGPGFLASPRFPAMLSRTQAFSGGAELWKIPSFTESTWSRRFNWLCNQLLVKDTVKTQLRELPDLQQLKDWGIHLPQKNTSSFSEAPVLFVSSEFLPNRWLHLSSAKRTESWILEGLNSAESLKVDGLRFFLPDEMSFSLFEKFWGNLSPELRHRPFEVSCVAD